MGKFQTFDEFLCFYREQRLSIIPIPFGKKEANIKWQVYQKRLASDAEIDMWFSNNQTNLAIVCGEVSGNLVVLDCDSEEKYLELKPIIEQKLQLDNLENYTPVVKTGKGYHIYFRTPTPVKSVKFPKLDIRGEGSYVIAPPSIHPNGKQYQFLKEPVPDIFVIASMGGIGIDLEQKPQGEIGGKPSWITEVLQHGADEGQRNDTCIRLAGYFKNSHPIDITEALLLDWNKKNKPPLPESRVLATVESAYKYAVVNNKYNIFNRGDFQSENAFSLKSGQVGGQVVDKLRDYGELSEPFDDFLKENPEPHWKREVAEIIGTTYRDEAFIKLIQRRAKAGDIKILAGGDKIQWVNKDWQRSKVNLEARKKAFLGLSLPFGAEESIAIPEHSQIVVAGDVGSGKTHFGYEIANLNVGKIPIRHFVNEIGDSKAVTNLDDYPLLLEHFDEDYFLINQDKEQLEVAENLDPIGLNIYDYLHLSASKEWFLLLQKELARLSQKLETGVIVVMLQKRLGESLAMGRDWTRMQAEIYFSLNIEKDVRGDDKQHGYKEVRIDIVKAKDWASSTNPEVLSCRYRTAPKHGKLVAYGDWFERNQG